MDSLDLCLTCGSHVSTAGAAYCSQGCRDVDLAPQHNTLRSEMPSLQYPVAHVPRSNYTTSASSSTTLMLASRPSPPRASSSTYTGRDRIGIAVWASRVSGGGSYGDHQQPDMSSTFESDDDDVPQLDLEDDEDEDFSSGSSSPREEITDDEEVVYDEDAVSDDDVLQRIPVRSAVRGRLPIVPIYSPVAASPALNSSLPRYKFPLTPSQPAPAAISTLAQQQHTSNASSSSRQPSTRKSSASFKPAPVAPVVGLKRHQYHQSAALSSSSSDDATSLQTPFTPASSAISHRRKEAAKWTTDPSNPFISSPPYDYSAKSRPTSAAKQQEQMLNQQFVDRGRSLYRADGW